MSHATKDLPTESTERDFYTNKTCFLEVGGKVYRVSIYDKEELAKHLVMIQFPELIQIPTLTRKEYKYWHR